MIPRGFIAGTLLGVSLCATHYFYTEEMMLGVIGAGLFALFGFIKTLEVLLSE